MSELPDRPRLRPVEAWPLVVDGQELIALRDPSRVAEAVVTLPRTAVDVLVLLDGSRTLDDIQADVLGRVGVVVPRGHLEILVRDLDGHLLLEGPRLEAERARLRETFRAAGARPAFHAGRAYPAASGSLARELDGHFAHPEGPGSAAPEPASRVLGLVAPHIDYARGGAAYAWAYRELLAGAAPECVIVLGTAHAGLDGHRFAATAKAHDTPFGPVPVDADVLQAIARRAGADLFAAEAAHRIEHSVEFQAVYLAYLAGRRGQGPAPAIVPILASFVHECLAAGRPPWTDPGVMRVLDAIREAMITVPRRYCVVAGADLAHVGPRFGDPAPLSVADRARVEREDRAFLDCVVGGDRQGLFAHVSRDGDRRRICGLSPIDALLAVLPESQGRLAAYGQWPDPQATVTFASVVFEAGA